MEREALLTQVNDALESEGRTLTLSEETINGELDDALEGVTDDNQVDETFVGRIVKRLKRMDGNLHKDVSVQVRAYKEAHPSPNPKQQKPKDGTVDEQKDTPDYAKKIDELMERLSKMEESRKVEAEKKANDAIVDSVKKGLRASFKAANIEANEYILKNTLRDMEIPAVEEGGHVDVDALVKKMERSYFKSLKEAGLDNKNTGGSRFGQRASGSGERAADDFFTKKARKEGWKK